MLAPPLKWIDIPRLLYSTAKVLWMTFWLGDLPETYQPIAGQAPSVELTERFWPVVGTLDGRQSIFIVNFGGILSWMFRVIQTICGLWITAVIVMKGIARIRGKSSLMKDGDYRSLWVIGLLMVLITSRLAIVSYVDAMSYWVQVRYMLVIYPALISLICLTLPFWPFPRQQDSKIEGTIHSVQRGILSVIYEGLAHVRQNVFSYCERRSDGR
jgi:hypothetical protein